MRSLIRHGLETIGCADTFCSGVLMLLSMSNYATDCLVHFCSQLLYHVPFPVSTAGGMQPDLLW